MRFKPEEQLKTLWYITWVMVFILGLVLWVVLIFTVNPLIFIIFLAAWFVIMVPFLFWIPKAYQVLEYSIEEDAIKMKEGVIWKKHVTIPYLKITNVDITQGPIQRALGIGVIHVQTAGAGGQQGQKAELKINGIKDLEELRDMILKKIKTYHLSKSGDTEKPLPAGIRELPAEENPALSNSLLRSILDELSYIRKKLEDKTIL